MPFSLFGKKKAAPEAREAARGIPAIRCSICTGEQVAGFRNRETGQELAAFTIRGTFPGETEATRDLLAAEHGLPPEQITVTIEDRAS